jgi:hypothetical protein
MAPILFCAVIASITAIGLVKRPKSPGYKIRPPRRGRCHGSRLMRRRPGGTGRIPNALALGAQVGVNF